MRGFHTKNEAGKLELRTREIFFDNTPTTKSELNRCSALVIIGERALWTSEIEEVIASSEKPVIFVDFSANILGSNSVETDFALLMGTALEHLLIIRQSCGAINKK